ncbi:gephyrin-like molybdotransferase Glp [Candidatus Magnetaquicoccus inordinatus]|uniref:molybdopterin molybdotransferase MoeA n=1 Tax=Candidatus Magnetaquicoccus inordinatus TaxID=2496818 RepID=UPI00102BA924|nr:gephyrin-like molybdotransferase Glp [Candidatus Magnetaquicoccus inordinatus]
MISFNEAKRRVLEQIQPVAPESKETPLAEALGRVLAQAIHASAPVPNHDNSAMDGYAVRSADLSAAPVQLKVVADLPAGSPPVAPLQAGEAVRIMTGAPIPQGSDCVVMQEVVTRHEEWVTIPAGQLPGQNIRPAGEDIAIGSTIFSAGHRLGVADLGLLTSLGKSTLPLFRRLRVAILSTGNEVVANDQPLAPGQVYDSNRATLRAALTQLGVLVLDLGAVGDDREALASAFQKGAEQADALISSGGVSVGDYDLVKEILSKDGQIHFWQVAMKPGKPQAYGRLGQAHFFGLPGNPVSSLSVFLLIVRPALLKLMGAAPEPERRFQALFRGTWNKRHSRMDFLRGIVHFAHPDGSLATPPWVEVTGGQGSGILTSLSKANVFIILPEGPLQIADGDPVTVQWIDYV